ncbi:MAG: outer membrane lipoprotein chaperone LolA [Gammaproteobacteria bacterium]|nr:outer membrane lipoprotein chaperone LolA [Gammaproteobacteria bacterium]
MRFSRQAIGVWVLSLACSMPVVASEAGDLLTQRLKDYRTYEARFTQYVVDKTGRRIQEMHGELKAKRPGLFFWHTQPPLEQVIVADGEEVRVYDPDLEQVTIQPMDTRITSTPALLLSGNVDGLNDAYEISRRGVNTQIEEYVLRPRNPDALFVSLTLWFQDGVLSEMRLEDSLAQRSTLGFEDVKVNGEVSDTAFTLTVPEGTDVIRSAE